MTKYKSAADWAEQQRGERQYKSAADWAANHVPEEKGSLPYQGLMAGVDKTQALISGGVGMFGDMIGHEGLEQWGRTAYEVNMAEAAMNPPPARFSEAAPAGDLSGLGEWALYTLAELAPTMATLILGGGIGGGLGRYAVRKGVEREFKSAARSQMRRGQWQGLQGEALRDAGKVAGGEAAGRVAGRGALLGATAGTWTGSTTLESGAIYQEILDETGEKRAGIAFPAGALAGSLDTIVPINILRRLGLGRVATKEVLESLAKQGIIKRIGREGSLNMFYEGTTEALQETIQMEALRWVDNNKEWFRDPEQWKMLVDAGAAGGLMGLTMGGMAGAVRPLFTPETDTRGFLDQEQDEPPRDPAIEQGLQELGDLRSKVEGGWADTPDWGDEYGVMPGRDPTIEERKESDDITERRYANIVEEKRDAIDRSMAELPEEERQTQQLVARDAEAAAQAEAQAEAAAVGPIDVAEVERASAEAAESPVSPQRIPTEGQRSAENYKIGRPDPAATMGLPVGIENPAGTERNGQVQTHPYGRLLDYRGADGGKMDVYLGSGSNIYVINQKDPETGRFDEEKVMAGFNSRQEAEEAYLSNYEPGWLDKQGGRLDTTEYTNVEDFKAWAEQVTQEREAKGGTKSTPTNLIGRHVRAGDVSGKVARVSKDGQKVTLESGQTVPVGQAANWAVQREPFTSQPEKPQEPATEPAEPTPTQSELVGKHVRSGSITGKVARVSKSGDKAMLESGQTVPVGKAPNWAVQDEPFDTGYRPDEAAPDESAFEPRRSKKKAAKRKTKRKAGKKARKKVSTEAEEQDVRDIVPPPTLDITTVGGETIDPEWMGQDALPNLSQESVVRQYVDKWSQLFEKSLGLKAHHRKPLSSDSIGRRVLVVLEALVDRAGFPRALVDRIPGVGITHEWAAPPGQFYVDFELWWNTKKHRNESIVIPPKSTFDLVAGRHQGRDDAYLSEVLTHEFGHFVDAGANHGGNRSFYSEASPRFDFPDEVVRASNPSVVEPIRIDTTRAGDIMQEALDVFVGNRGKLKQFLNYPFSKLVTYAKLKWKVENPSPTDTLEDIGRAEKQMEFLRFIFKVEVFAQLHSLYYNHPARLQSASPKLYEFMQEVHDAVISAKSDRDFDVGLRNAFRADPNKLDQLSQLVRFEQGAEKVAEDWQAVEAAAPGRDGRRGRSRSERAREQARQTKAAEEKSGGITLNMESSPSGEVTRELVTLDLYSAVLEAAKGLKAEKAPAKQMLQMLKKTEGVKAEEIEWSGVGEWLEMVAAGEANPEAIGITTGMKDEWDRVMAAAPFFEQHGFYKKQDDKWVYQEPNDIFPGAGEEAMIGKVKALGLLKIHAGDKEKAKADARQNAINEDDVFNEKARDLWRYVETLIDKADLSDMEYLGPSLLVNPIRDAFRYTGTILPPKSAFDQALESIRKYVPDAFEGDKYPYPKWKPGVVTRDQVVKFARENQIEMEEVHAEQSSAEAFEGFNWNEEIDEDSSNWDHILEDLLDQFDNGEREFGFWEEDNWADENWIELRDYVQGAFHLTEAQEGRIDEVGGINELEEFVESEGLTTIPDLLREDEIVSAMRVDFHDKAAGEAREIYFDNPRLILRDSHYEVELTGNDDMGWQIEVDGRHVGHEYSVSEAEVVARDHLDLDDMDSDNPEVARWGDDSYTAEGYDEYKELKLTLKASDLHRDFHQFAHFPDANIIAFGRITYRAFDGQPGDSYMVDEAQSDLHQAAIEAYGYTKYSPTQEELSEARNETIDTDAQLRQDLTGRGIRKFLPLVGARGSFDSHADAQHEIESTQSAVMTLLFNNMNPNKAYKSGAIRRFIFPTTEYESIAETLKQRSDFKEIVAAAKPWIKARREQERLEQNIPDAPFKNKNDAWLRLIIAKTLLDAATKPRMKSYGWANAAQVAERWSDQYAQAYTHQYDEKFPAIVQRLTGKLPRRTNMDGDTFRVFQATRNDMFNGETWAIEDPSNEVVKGDDGNIMFFSSEEAAAKHINENLMYPDEPGWWIIDLDDTLREEILQKRFALFARQRTLFNPELPGHKPADTVKGVKRLTGVMPADLGIEVVATESALREALGLDRTVNLQGVRGYHDRATDKTFLVAENLTDESLYPTLLHEIGAHHGLPKMLGKDRYQKILDRLKALHEKGDPAVLEAYYQALSAEREGGRPSDRWDEVLAYLAENPNNHTYSKDLRGLIQRVWAQVKAWLAKQGWLKPERLSDRDIVELVRGALHQQAARAPQRGPAGPATGILRADNVDDRTTIGMYSQLARAAKQLKAERGAPMQMLQMLKKADGVKQEELEWTGLEEWLKLIQSGQIKKVNAKGKPSVTRDEIVSFLDLNGVRLEEKFVRLSEERHRALSNMNVVWDEGEPIRDDSYMEREHIEAEIKAVSDVPLEEVDTGYWSFDNWVMENKERIASYIGGYWWGGAQPTARRALSDDIRRAESADDIIELVETRARSATEARHRRDELIDELEENASGSRLTGHLRLTEIDRVYEAVYRDYPRFAPPGQSLMDFINSRYADAVGGEQTIKRLVQFVQENRALFEELQEISTSQAVVDLAGTEVRGPGATTTLGGLFRNKIRLALQEATQAHVRSKGNQDPPMNYRSPSHPDVSIVYSRGKYRAHGGAGAKNFDNLDEAKAWVEAQIKQRWKPEQNRKDPDTVSWARSSYNVLPGWDDYAEYKVYIPGAEWVATAIHYEEPGQLFYMRVTERSIGSFRDVFALDEFQSDPHRIGGKHGYTNLSEEDKQNLEREIEQKASEQDRLRVELFDIFHDKAGLSYDEFNMVHLSIVRDGPPPRRVNEFFNARPDVKELLGNVKEKADKFREVSKELDELVAFAREEESKFPDVPFKNKAWVSLAAKAGLLQAARGGAKYFAWPTSRVLEKRYSDAYRKLYVAKYDVQMPAAIKKLLKREPMIVDLDGNPMPDRDTEIQQLLGQFTILQNSTANGTRWMVFDHQGARINQFRDLFTEEEARAYARDQAERILDTSQEFNTMRPGWYVIELDDALRQKILQESFALFARGPVFGKNKRKQSHVAFTMDGKAVKTSHPSIDEMGAIKEFVVRNFAKEGRLTDEAFDRHIESMGIKNVGELEIQFMVADFIKTAEKTLRKPWRKISDAEKEAMNNYLAGHDTPKIPAAIREQLDMLRTSLDAQSAKVQEMVLDEIDYRLAALPVKKRQAAIEYMDNFSNLEETDIDEGNIDPMIVAKTKLWNTIEENKGRYLNRSYRAFDDDKWHKNVPRSTIGRAKQFLLEQINKDKYFQDMDQEAKEAHADGIINSLLRPNARDLFSFMSSEQLGQKDLSILKKRKDIAPEIRALMGEYKDPRMNYARSMGKMTYLVANHHFLKKVREDGLGVFLSAKKSGRMSQRITSWDERTMVPLAGLYATPEFARALHEAVQPHVTEGWLRAYLMMNTGVKYGKASAVDATVYTPSGAKTMGEIKEGDWVLGAGGQTQVLGVYPQGVQDIYKVTFVDGSQTEVSEEHLWEVAKSGDESKHYPRAPHIMTTAELMALPEHELKKRFVPLGVAMFNEQEVPLSPYLIGALLGDGGMTTSSLRFSNIDKPVLDRVEAELPSGYSLRLNDSRKTGQCDYMVAAEQHYTKMPERIIPILRRLDLWGKYSHEKFIPAAYKYNGWHQRMELMRGLMDTDGWVVRDGQLAYCTTSKQLALDVQEVAESLGASVLMWEKLVEGRRPSYNLKLRVPDAPEWFHCQRKKEGAWNKKRPVRRFFKSIELVGQKECQCIYVADPRHLYMTDRFILTHNTVLSPTTMARNFYSAAMFTVLNGHFNWTHAVKATAHTWADLGTSNKKRYEYLHKLVKMGVLHDNPRASELKAALDEVADMDVYESSMPGRALKTLLNGATKAYRAGDDFWKIVGFENEKAGFMRHGMSEADAEKKAAERIRNGYPTYSMVPKSIQFLRRFPLVGTFVSFPWEMLRTTSHQFRMMKEDREAGRHDMVAKRAVGMAIATALSAGISYATMALLGVDDEDDEAVRRMGPSWQENSQLAYMGYDEQGRLRYLDLSHLDPYEYIKRPFTAMVNGNYEGLDEKLVAAIKEFLDPFLGTEIGAGALMQAWANKTEYGSEVYDEHADVFTQGKQVFSHLRKALQPGVFSNMERTLKAWSDEYASYGRKYDKGDEALAWVGFRMTTMDPHVSLRFRSYEFNDARSAASRPVYRIFRDPNIGAYQDMGRAVKQSKAIWEEGWRDMLAVVRASRKMGLSDAEIRDSLRWGGTAKKYIPFLLRGDIPAWEPYEPTLRKARVSVIRTRDSSRERAAMQREFILRRQALSEALGAAQ